MQDHNIPQKANDFIIHSPAWFDQHQIWISDGARHLYKTLLSMADQRTGRLFIPGKAWITFRSIERKAGMCVRTRKKYMCELIALGAVHIHRDRVIRVIGGRKRVVLGQAQITVRPLKPPKPHEHGVSSTVQTAEHAKQPRKQRVSSTVQSSTVQAESGLLRCKSCTVQEMHPQYSSNPTKGQGAGVVCSSDGVGGVGGGGHHHQVPTEKLRKLPAVTARAGSVSIGVFGSEGQTPNTETSKTDNTDSDPRQEKTPETPPIQMLAPRSPTGRPLAPDPPENDADKTTRFLESTCRAFPELPPQFVELLFSRVYVQAGEWNSEPERAAYYITGVRKVLNDSETKCQLCEEWRTAKIEFFVRRLARDYATDEQTLGILRMRIAKLLPRPEPAGVDAEDFLRQFRARYVRTARTQCETQVRQRSAGP